jgi:ankyrin repeat protein
LLAQLHIRSVARQDNLDAVRNALQELPADLDVLYDQAMERISAQGSHDRRRAMQVLMWISCAARPLNIKELQHAIVAQSNPESMGQDVLPARSRLVAVCAGLVQIEPYSTVIRLVHETTQSYFEKNRDRYFPNAYSEITRACLSYLSFRAFSSGPCSRDEDFRLRLKKWGFLEYASRYWGKHAFESPEFPHLDAIETFMADERKLASSIQASYAPVSLSTHYPKPVGPIWVAASFGASSLLPRLVRKLRNNRLELVYMALHFAQSGGYVDAVQILCGTLKTMNVNVDLSTLTSWRIGESTLNHAIRSGHDEVVAALLQGKPKLNRDDGETDQYYPPLFLAVSERREVAVKLLLRAGANANVDVRSKPVLYLAVELVNKRYWKLDGPMSRLAQPVRAPKNVSYPVETSFVRMLLEHGADPNASWLAHTVLDVAAQVDDDGRIAEMLLNAGAAATKNTLEIAISDGSTRLVELLLKWIRTVEGKSPKSPGLAHRIDETCWLMSSKKSWDALVVKMLGVKPFEDFLIHWARNGDDPPLQESALLHYACAQSSASSIISLLERGVNIESINEDGFTPLRSAARRGDMSPVETLLDRGANINASTPDRYFTALHLAAYNCYEEVVKSLVRRGANVLAEDSEGLTPLDVALKQREEDRNLLPKETKNLPQANLRSLPLVRFDLSDDPVYRSFLVRWRSSWRSIVDVLEPATREAKIRARKWPR